MKRLIFILAVSAALCSSALAQSPDEALKRYVPILPSVKAQFFEIDPKLGYAVKKMGGGVYVISDNMWQSAFFVTDDGVIVFDAPESFGKSIPAAIAKVTDKPIKYLVYSHAHKDHIGGSAAFKDIKGLKIVAVEGVTALLQEQQDPNRLIPDVVFATGRQSHSVEKLSNSRAISITPSKVIFSSTCRRPNS